MVTRQRKIFRWRLYAWCILGVLILYGDDYRPNDIDRATAPYQFSVVSWELANLPDKWVTTRLVDGPPGDLYRQ